MRISSSRIRETGWRVRTKANTSPFRRIKGVNAIDNAAKTAASSAAAFARGGARPNVARESAARHLDTANQTNNQDPRAGVGMSPIGVLPGFYCDPTGAPPGPKPTPDAPQRESSTLDFERQYYENPPF